jgi:hypothetical protein
LFRILQVACRPFAWDFAEAKPGEGGGGGGPAFKGVRFGEIVGHAFSGSELYGGVATWTVRFDEPEPEAAELPEGPAADPEGPPLGRRSSSRSRNSNSSSSSPSSGGERRRSGGEGAAAGHSPRRDRGPATATVRTPELRAALDLRHHVGCNLSAPPGVPGWTVCKSRSTAEYYFAQPAVGSQWHRPGLTPSAPGDRERCRASCAVWGHRSKANVQDHKATLLVLVLKLGQFFF